MTEVYLVGYDVARVHGYVFEPVRPMDVMGGSLLLEEFAEDARRLAEGRGAEVITSAGGRGIFRTADEAAARGLAHEIRSLLDQLTAGGARCTVAWVRPDGDFAAAQRALGAELRRRRFEEEVEQEAPQLVQPGTRPEGICQACGREPADVEQKVGGESERIGRRCEKRREKGVGVSPTIGEVVGGTREEVPRGAVLGAAYLDGDGLGRRMAEIADPRELSRLSSRLSGALKDSFKAVERRLGGLRLLWVAAGGDDALVFCDARRLLELLQALWEAVEPLGAELGVTFSTGVVVGEPLLPLRLYFAGAEEALREAKACGRLSGEPHVGVRGLMAGTRHGRRGDLFGGPLPQEAFRASEGGIRGLIEAVARLAPSQRAGLADDLSLQSVQEAVLAVEYRASRSDEGGMARALQVARDLKGRHGGRRPPSAGPLELDLLRGALVFTSFGG